MWGLKTQHPVFVGRHCGKAKHGKMNLICKQHPTPQLSAAMKEPQIHTGRFALFASSVPPSSQQLWYSGVPFPKEERETSGYGHFSVGRQVQHLHHKNEERQDLSRPILTTRFIPILHSPRDIGFQPTHCEAPRSDRKAQHLSKRHVESCVVVDTSDQRCQCVEPIEFLFQRDTICVRQGFEVNLNKPRNAIQLYHLVSLECLCHQVEVRALPGGKAIEKNGLPEIECMFSGIILGLRCDTNIRDTIPC